MRLVLCDDHQLLLDVLTTALTAHGYLVEATVSSARAVAEVVRRTDPDVCLLDVCFPDGGGVEVACELTAVAPRTKVVMLSVSSEPEVVAAAVAAGAAGFTRKDQAIDGIIRVLQRVQRGETVIDVSGRSSAPRRSTGDSEASRLLRHLTEREVEVLQRLVDGETTEALAHGLGITVHTARTHVQKILVKLGVHTRLQAATMVMNAGLMQPNPAPSLRPTP
jgi:two-component system, NarL family, nitrate/nitrite response regulator NarL